MGINVYLRWDNQTNAEHEAQYTGFSVIAGKVGYLREAYHGAPYATKVLVPEGWSDSEDGVSITSATLRQRLAATINAAKVRSEKIYGETLPDYSPVLQSYRDFVALFEEKEKAGLNPRIVVSA